MADIKFTGASTSPANTQQYVISKAGLQALAAATITKITGPTPITGGKSITVYTGAGIPTTIGVGSAITFKQLNGNDLAPSTVAQADRERGTFRVTVDGSTYDVPIVIKNWTPTTTNTYSLGSATDIWASLYARGAVFGRAATDDLAAIEPTNIRPAIDNKGNLGTASTRWSNLYVVNAGASATPITNGYFTNLTVTNLNLPAGNNDSAFDLKGGTTAQFLRGNGSNKNPIWSNTLEGDLYLAKVTQGISVIQTQLHNNNNDGTTAQYAKNTDAAIYTTGGICAEKNIWGAKIFNAVFNDYAEYRTTIDLIPGCVVIDQDDGSLACSSDRLQPGAQVISDTFGHCMGATPTAQTPIAVAGRVLVYPYQNRNNYHAGMAVCSAPGGTVDIMTRDEIRDYPDCIVGIVSEIPEYEEWGSDNVKVNGRIWIRVK